ncbi:MAG TPA: YitT family protein [Firmicutes bacterium]|nr:YitT family protein [Bacillota bacterium]
MEATGWGETEDARCEVGGSGVRERLVNLAQISAGALITALGLNLFLIPNRIAAGGVSGVATILYYILGWPVGPTMLAINIPLFAAAVHFLGGRFGVRTLAGALLLSVFVSLTARFGPLTTNTLLAAIYGGIAGGIGMGIVFRAGGTTGGTDLAAALLHRFLRLSYGKGLLTIDSLVITVAGVVFSPELALYALVTLFLTSRVIDLVQEGETYAKAAFIISEEAEAIRKAVLEEMGRGVTLFKVEGGYTGQARSALLCVVTQAELPRLKKAVAACDKQAFVIVGSVYEVLGEGWEGS